MPTLSQYANVNNTAVALLEKKGYQVWREDDQRLLGGARWVGLRCGRSGGAVGGRRHLRGHPAHGVSRVLVAQRGRRGRVCTVADPPAAELSISRRSALTGGSVAAASAHPRRRLSVA